MGMMGGTGFGSFGLIGMVLNLVITVGVIIGIVLLVNWLVRRFSANGQNAIGLSGQAQPQLSAREILQTRYARGEITREQFQQMLADLD